MKVVDLYSKRQKRLRGEVPDVYVYDDIPNEFRIQVIHIWKDAFGEAIHMRDAGQIFHSIERMLCREYGLLGLAKFPLTGYRAVEDYFRSCKVVDKVLDIIELSFKAMPQKSAFRGRMEPVDAIKELNFRFQEHGLGYQFESGELIRVDSQFIHAEAVKPALSLLADKNYEGANEEFLKAHEHYRHGRIKECLNDCLKAFESTMKAICDKRGWAYNPTDTASKLIDVCFKNGLIPGFLQSEFGGLEACLKSGFLLSGIRWAGMGRVLNLWLSPAT